MQFHYVDAPEIKVSVGMTTGQIKQVINFLYHLSAQIEDGFEKQNLMSRIMELQSVYEQAMITIESYAQGQQNNV